MEKKEKRREQYIKCAFWNFEHCTEKNGLSSDHSIYQLAEDCLKSYTSKRFTKLFHLEAKGIDLHPESKSKIQL